MTPLTVYRTATRKARRMHGDQKWWQPLNIMARALRQMPVTDLQRTLTEARQRAGNDKIPWLQRVDAKHIAWAMQEALRRRPLTA